MNTRPISEDDLHAYADNRLDATRRTEVEQWLGEHPEAREQIAAWQTQSRLLHETYDTVMTQPVPRRLLEAASRRSPMPHLRVAAALAWLAIGGLIGFVLRGEWPSRAEGMSASLPYRAAVAHAVYSPEVRHPVEVAADQEGHLVDWLSKRLGAKVRAPRLGEVGYELVGGRLLPGEREPVAQFMYQTAAGQRLTLYVRRTTEPGGETAFRYAQEGRIGVFYWIDGDFGYALSAEAPKDDLLRVATAVYQQISR